MLGNVSKRCHATFTKHWASHASQINMFMFRILQRQHTAAFRGQYDQWPRHDGMLDACGHCQDQVCLVLFFRCPFELLLLCGNMHTN